MALRVHVGRLYEYRHQPGFWRRQHCKRRVRKVDDSPRSHQTTARAAIGDGNHNAPAWPRRIVNRHAHARTQWVEPRSSGKFVRVEWVAVGHRLAAVLFTIPGGQTRRGRRGCWRSSNRQGEERGRNDQRRFHRNQPYQSHSNKPVRATHKLFTSSIRFASMREQSPPSGLKDKDRISDEQHKVYKSCS